VASTIAYLVLFFALAGAAGRFGANALALAICTAANTAVHRHYTFARRHPSHRDLLLGGMAVFVTSLTVTSVALALIDGIGIRSGWVQAGLLVGANGSAALVRFIVLRSWMFRTARTRSFAAGAERRRSELQKERHTG
jgi:putative flippase GtrA